MTDLDLLDEAEGAEAPILETEVALEAEMEPQLIREHQAWLAEDASSKPDVSASDRVVSAVA